MTGSQGNIPKQLLAVFCLFQTNYINYISKQIKRKRILVLLRWQGEAQTSFCSGYFLIMERIRGGTPGNPRRPFPLQPGIFWCLRRSHGPDYLRPLGNAHSCVFVPHTVWCRCLGCFYQPQDFPAFRLTFLTNGTTALRYRAR